jgi:hypothetical protein
MEIGMIIMNYVQVLYIRVAPTIKRAEFVSYRMSYMTLRGCWCDIIVLNVHAPTEDKIDDMKDGFVGTSHSPNTQFLLLRST